MWHHAPQHIYLCINIFIFISTSQQPDRESFFLHPEPSAGCKLTMGASRHGGWHIALTKDLENISCHLSTCCIFTVYFISFSLRPTTRSLVF